MFYYVFRHIERVYMGGFLVQVFGIGEVRVDLYTLGPENVVFKLFSDIKREKIVEPPFNSSKGTRCGRF